MWNKTETRLARILEASKKKVNDLDLITSGGEGVRYLNCSRKIVNFPIFMYVCLFLNINFLYFKNIT